MPNLIVHPPKREPNCLWLIENTHAKCFRRNLPFSKIRCINGLSLKSTITYLKNSRSRPIAPPAGSGISHLCLSKLWSSTSVSRSRHRPEKRLWRDKSAAAPIRGLWQDRCKSAVRRRRRIEIRPNSLYRQFAFIFNFKSIDCRIPVSNLFLSLW
jgi:hypothetical protein